MILYMGKEVLIILLQFLIMSVVGLALLYFPQRMIDYGFAYVVHHIDDGKEIVTKRYNKYIIGLNKNYEIKDESNISKLLTGWVYVFAGFVFIMSGFVLVGIGIFMAIVSLI